MEKNINGNPGFGYTCRAAMLCFRRASVAVFSAIARLTILAKAGFLHLKRQITGDNVGK